MKKSIVQEKNYAFAIRIVVLYKYLIDTKKEFTLAKQMLRSGTSVGALVREAEQAESKADFIHKLSVAHKEANEAEYWLNLLKDTNYIDSQLFDSMNNDCKEIIALLTSILKDCKEKNNIINLSIHNSFSVFHFQFSI
ncbi:MAG: four helix bundle protein [Alphaproteobacteria bacterium]|nr:four helix bundle protein [Alphaproteobacteria bacterium]